MADVHSKDVRSYNMSRIKGENTKPEILVRKFLFSHGIRYRLHDKRFPGKPDLVVPKFKTVLFVHGCFWHGHPKCKYYVVPKSRTEWWLSKINGNIKRDAESVEKLEREGWKVITIWECDLKDNKKEVTLQLLLKQLKNK
ncbi:DNA mismatch endonuclease Vsr [Chitinophaga sedimenti]|uniref:very short patch repair endonuclease n=1 Tax=Chitinophaga sedimenti TaxID=2033606 RepID=UPI002002F48E|nr:DNA mismatch endonuclease Vsr [Chitinophaga sedimenti]MCK7554050.1 DNA mismatch endonuclease Vsr [Chitinophaga sedimenti]